MSDSEKLLNTWEFAHTDSNTLTNIIETLKCYQKNGDGSINISFKKVPSDLAITVQKLQMHTRENSVLRFRMDNIESSLNKLQVRINKIETQMDLFETEIKNQIKQEILEEMERRIANATFEKKGPGLWDRVRGYFVNKKTRMEVSKQLL
jgi:predicted nuclease with TOPRIM domain